MTQPARGGTSSSIDPILEGILRAADGGEAREALDDLVARHLSSVIRVAIARRARPPMGRPGETADAAVAARLQAVAERHVGARLLALRRGAAAAREAHDLGDVRTWAAGVAARTSDDWIRRGFPARVRMRHRLRYLLAHDRRFLLRATPDEAWRCGLAARDARVFASGEASGPGRRIIETPPVVKSRDPGALAPAAIANLVADLLARAGGPVDLDHLTDAVLERLGDLWDAAQTADAGPDSAATGAGAPPGAGAATAGTAVKPGDGGASAWVAHLWAEIGRLPSLQRTALLLNLRDADGHAVLGLFPIAGAAGLRAIAAAAGTTGEKLAEQWRALPLDDATIAARMGLPRSQVARLRRTAHERLARRLAEAT
jgi:hypothetical protein